MLVVEAEEEVAEEVDGGGVGPVDVVDEHHRRRGAHVLEHEVREREELAGALALDDLGGGVGERFADVGAGPLDHRDVVVAPAAGGEGVGDRGEEGVAEGEVGKVEAVVAAAALHRRPAPARVFERLVGEAGIADARLTLDDDEVREPAQREIDAAAEPGKFGPPPDQRARHRVSVQVGADNCHRVSASSIACTHISHTFMRSMPTTSSRVASSTCSNRSSRSSVLRTRCGPSTPSRYPMNPSTGRRWIPPRQSRSAATTVPTTATIKVISFQVCALISRETSSSLVLDLAHASPTVPVSLRGCASPVSETCMVQT